MPTPIDADIAAALTSSPPSCRLWPEQTEGPYHREVHPERRDITEGLPGLPLRVGLRLLDPAGAPRADVLVEVWQADVEGRYSGFRAYLPVPGQPVTSESVPHDVIAAGETFLRGAQRTDANGMCEFQTIYPGWYASRTVHIHLIAHLDDRHVTTQLYFADEVTDAVFAFSPYRDRPPRDTTNATDTIFVDGGEQTLLAVSGDPATSLAGTLCMTVRESRAR